MDVPIGLGQADPHVEAWLMDDPVAVRRGPDWAEVEGADHLRGVDVDMNDLPDAALALAVVMLFAEGPSRIRNVPNLFTCLHEKTNERIVESGTDKPQGRFFLNIFHNASDNGGRGE